MFQRAGPAAYKNSLENTLKLDEIYNYPHRNFKSIHVAGTNGKGSVSHMLASVLQEAGYKTGLYTSPHLKDFRERIRINGEMISENDVVTWVENFWRRNQQWKIEPSFFELTVAMAFDHFSQQKVDIAVVEVGLGGRLDSTNIISPELSIITNIGLDHTNLLGETLEEIAVEKAGIIKRKIPVIVGTTQQNIAKVFKQYANSNKAPVYFADQEFLVNYSMMGMDGNQIVSVEKDGKIVYPNLTLDLKGIYQQKNLPAVLKSINLLVKNGWNISEQNIYNGLRSTLKNTHLLGRWQVIGNNPLIVCDTGHNEDGIKAIVSQLENTPFKALHFIFGTVADKNPEPVLKLLPKNASYYFVKAKIERAFEEKKLQKIANEFGLIGEPYSSVSEAFKTAQSRAEKHDLIFVGGSTFVVAEIL